MQSQLMADKRRGVFNLQKGSVYALMLALLSPFAMYNLPLINMGFATVSIAVSMLYAGGIILLNSRKIRYSLVVPIYLYAGWNILKSGGDLQSILLCIAIMVHTTAISTGCIHADTLKKAIVTVSCVAAVGVIIQQVAHILFSVHIPMVAPDFILENNKGYTDGLLTGLSDDGGYRPCSIFLEPSHLAQYCYVGIAISLLDKRNLNITKAVLISLGILCSTSGMGIVMVGLVWGYYFLAEVHTVSFEEKVKRIVLYGFLAVLVLGIASRVPSVQFTFRRIFTTEKGEYNAINGRLFWWDSYMTSLSGKSLLLGLGSSKLPDVYFTGIMRILYAYGIVGAVLFYGVLISFFCRKNTVVRFLSLMMGGLMVFANFTGFISMIFYFGVMITLLDGSYAYKRRGMKQCTIDC